MSDRSPSLTDMSSFRNITVASDGSPGAQAAVERAAQLAAQHASASALSASTDPTVATSA